MYCFEISREYVRIFLHPIGVSLVESFNLVSNVWYGWDHNVECVDNDSEIFVLKPLKYFYIWILVPTLGREIQGLRIALLNSILARLRIYHKDTIVIMYLARPDYLDKRIAECSRDSNKYCNKYWTLKKRLVIHVRKSWREYALQNYSSIRCASLEGIFLICVLSSSRIASSSSWQDKMIA